MLDTESLRHLLSCVAAGQLSPDAALTTLQQLQSEPVDTFAQVDHHRALRTGFPEVIWGQDKSATQIAQIMKAQRDGLRQTAKHRSSQTRPQAIMATRVSPEVYAEVQTQILGTQYFELARICAIPSAPDNDLLLPPRPGSIGILTAGTSDLPVAEEAAVTAELSGFRVERLWDVGVAGIHRLLDNREVLARADVLIVVAGMEGALPSVVGGMAQCPVIAVPTSIGYGASFGGLAALLGMLNSCAAGVGVVNIDNGFGAAILAGQILRTAGRIQGRMPD